MLFIHQAPRNWQENGRQGAVTPTRQGAPGDPRLVGRNSSGRRTPSGTTSGNQRRPSSAVGSGPANNGGNAISNAGGDSPARRGQVAERPRANTPSRPGSASSGLGRFAVRPHSPPTSARTGAPAAHGDVPQQQTQMPRPVTPTGGRSSSSGRIQQNGRVRVPSSGPVASLPIHVTTVGRPRTPTAQRRAPSHGGADPPTGERRGSADKPWPPTGNDAASTATTATGGATREASGHQTSGRSDGSVPGGSNNLTTVISSALDYKRFLDRRKQMIQQQVETAQQATTTTRPDQSASGEARSGGNGDADIGASEAAGLPAPSPVPASSSSSPVGGWNPGASGPVKASHMVQTAVNAAATTVAQAAPAGQDCGFDDEVAGVNRQRAQSAGGAPALVRRPSQDGGVSKGSLAADASGEDIGAATLNSARSCGSSTGTQHLLRRVCVAPEQTRAASVPLVANTNSSASAALERPASETGRSSSRNINSVPVGGARQACRSLGQQDGRERAYSAAQGETTELDFPVGDSSAVGSAVGSAAARTQSTPAARQQAGRERESSVDGMLRDVGESRAGSGSLSGNAIEDYIVGKQIGQGAYATVYFGLHKETSRKVAIKIYEKYKLLDPQRRKSVRCEIRLMERMRHPNIVVFHDALDTAKQIYIIMEFVGGGSMHHYLKKRPGRRLEDHVAKRLFYQVCQGLRYLHDRHIVHRDIKLENLLLDESGTVKIIDFGFSTIVPPGKKLKVFCGTPSYMAPEIVARKEYSGFCADIWAAGVLLYALLCGSFPFRGQNDRDLYRKIVRGVLHIPDLVGDGARNLLGRILTPDMARRPTVEDCLSDVWMQGHRDELYEGGRSKSSCSGYQPNTSTSSTATTAAPSSSAGQSAREISAGTPDLSGSVERRAPSAGSTSGGRVIQERPSSGHPNNRSASAIPPGMQAAQQQPPKSTTPSAAPSASMAPDGGNAGGATGASAAAAGPAAAVDKVASASSSGAAGSKGAVANVQPAPAAAAASPSESLEQPVQATSAGSAAASAVPSVSGGSSGNRRIEEEAISKLERLGYPYEEIIRQLKDDSSHLCKLYHRFLKALTAWDSKR